MKNKALSAIATALVLSLICGCVHPNIRTAESFVSAKKDGRFDDARVFLVDDPRVWYDSPEGDGSPWTLGGGRYSTWDREFHGKSTPGSWHVEDDSIWRVVEEWNDYYKLIERSDTPRYRRTYFFDEEEIRGTMISAAYPDRESIPSESRFDEVKAWAETNHADEWEYLRPGGSLDPTGDRAERTRKLFNQWRVEVDYRPWNRSDRCHPTTGTAPACGVAATRRTVVAWGAASGVVAGRKARPEGADESSVRPLMAAQVDES